MEKILIRKKFRWKMSLVLTPIPLLTLIAYVVEIIERDRAAWINEYVVGAILIIVNLVVWHAIYANIRWPSESIEMKLLSQSKVIINKNNRKGVKTLVLDPSNIKYLSQRGNNTSDWYVEAVTISGERLNLCDTWERNRLYFIAKEDILRIYEFFFSANPNIEIDYRGLSECGLSGGELYRFPAAPNSPPETGEFKNLGTVSPPPEGHDDDKNQAVKPAETKNAMP